MLRTDSFPALSSTHRAKAFANVAKYSDARVVDQHIECAEFGVDEAEQLGNLFMVSNIGSFPLDFTGCFRRQLGDRTIDAFLALTTNCHGGAFEQQHLRDGASYTARTAGNQANLLTEWFHADQHRPRGWDCRA